MDRAQRKLNRRLAILKPIAFYGQMLGLAYSLGSRCLRIYLDGQLLSMKLPLSMLCFACLALWSLARIQLGSNLTFFAVPGQRLVKTGLYRRLRNPIYYFGTLGMVSYALLIEQYYALWLLLLIVPVQAVRSLRERAVLKDKFDDEFVLYERQLWF